MNSSVNSVPFVCDAELSGNFYRLSRSMLINLAHLERLESNHLYMTGSNAPIRIPVSNRKELMNKLMVIKTK